MIRGDHAPNRESDRCRRQEVACGISPASNANGAEQPDGTVLVTDGLHRDQEHRAVFWILEAADIDEALAWARKAAIACDVAARCASFFFTRTRREQRNSHGDCDA